RRRHTCCYRDCSSDVCSSDLDLVDLLTIGCFFLGNHACRPGPIRYLLSEVITLAELLAQDLNDIVGVAVVLGKDQRFGHFGAARSEERRVGMAWTGAWERAGM